MSAKTGALWERKEHKDDEDELPVGNSKLFLNRRIHRDYRVNEIFRKKATKIEEIDGEDADENLDEFGNLKTNEKQEKSAEIGSEEKNRTEEPPDAEDETKKKKVYIKFSLSLSRNFIVHLVCIII